MNKRFLAVILIAIAFLVGAVAISKNKSADTPDARPSSNYYGKLDSKVTLTEYVDFQCEACYAYYPVVKQVKELYKDRVRFQVANFPITNKHQFAMQAARSAEAAARQGKFWEMHNKIFENQKTWEREKTVTATFEGYAKELGLDLAKYNNDLVSSDVFGVVNKDLADINALGGNGTPSFVLNGKLIESPGKTVEGFSKLLDNALAEAESN
jgi:protein-disulfide isomerase